MKIKDIMDVQNKEHIQLEIIFRPDYAGSRGIPLATTSP
jgi:hypothetical protein